MLETPPLYCYVSKLMLSFSHLFFLLCYIIIYRRWSYVNLSNVNLVCKIVSMRSWLVHDNPGHFLAILSPFASSTVCSIFHVPSQRTALHDARFCCGAIFAFSWADEEYFNSMAHILPHMRKECITTVKRFASLVEKLIL